MIAQYDKSGFVFWSKRNETFVICYNPDFPASEVRWTLFHEMGHIYLRHVSPQSPIMQRNGNSNPLLEFEAQEFARNVLCPPVVLFNCDAVEPDEIVEICGVPEEEAAVASQNIKVFSSLNVHPLEVAVERRFNTFVIESKKNGTQSTYFITIKPFGVWFAKRSANFIIFYSGKGKKDNANTMYVLWNHYPNVCRKRRSA